MPRQHMHLLPLALLLILSMVATSNARPVRPSRPPLPPVTPAAALAACEATNLTTFNARLTNVSVNINSALSQNTTHSSTRQQDKILWEGSIPGNLLGLNLWPGCSFEGDEITTTTLDGLNYMQLTELASQEKPYCSWDAAANVVAFSAVVDFELEDTEALGVEVDLRYKGKFCNLHGLDIEYAKVVASINGLAGNGTINVSGYVNDTFACIDSVTVASMDLVYSSVTAVASVPPLDLSKDLSSKVADKLNEKLPTAAANIEQHINTVMAAKMPACTPVNLS